jgi:hypothetical protein
MSNPKVIDTSRRRFITSASSLFLGMSLFPYTGITGQQAVKSQEVPEKLSLDQLEWIERSKMAEDMKNFFGRGYSCAESLLIVALRYLDKPEDLVWAAAGFGGGLYHKDLCGFLTGGIMGIGFFSGSLNKEREKAKDVCSDLVKQYWKWWTSRYPLRCAEIRPTGSPRSICENLGKIAAAKLEEMFISAAIQ